MNKDWLIFIAVLLVIMILAIIIYKIRTGKIKKTDCNDSPIDNILDIWPD